MYKASVPDLATPGDTAGVALHKSLDLHQILAIGPTDLHLCHYRNNHIFIIITLKPGQCFYCFLNTEWHGPGMRPFAWKNDLHEFYRDIWEDMNTGVATCNSTPTNRERQLWKIK